MMAIKSNIGGIRIATINDLEELKQSISSGDSNVSFLIGEDGSTTLRIENSDGSVDELVIANTQEMGEEIDSLQTQIAELSQKEDSDTVYDDTELVNRITALEERVDLDTVYDDTEVLKRINALENKIDLDTVYDDTQLTERIIALEERIDNDTIYDDTELVNRITELENRPDNDTTYTAGSNIRINENNVISAIIPTQEGTIEYDDEPLWTALGTKQDTLTAGDNIIINDNAISAIDTVYDDTELRGLVAEISNRVDNDTIYDDTEVRTLITELQERVDNDTVYDDAEVRGLISNLQTEIDNLDNYDDTEVRGLISQLQTTVDSWTDTVYDDTEIRGLIAELQSRPDKDTVYDDTEIQNSINTLSDNLSGVEQDVRDIVNKFGQPSGMATLDGNGHVPSAQLPSYVDDVLEFETLQSLPESGESGKIYVTTSDNKTYRWGGTEYVEISASLALGTTDSTAYRGDYGDIAYKHSQATGNVHNLTASDIGAATTEQLAELQASQSEISGVIFITETEYNSMVASGTLGSDTYVVYRPTV